MGIGRDLEETAEIRENIREISTVVKIMKRVIKSHPEAQVQFEQEIIMAKLKGEIT